MNNLKEFRKPVILKNIGKHTIPAILRPSKYYKVSPGIFNNYGVTVNHPFDADGVVSCFNFLENGTLEYTARIVNTEHRMKEEAANKRLYTGIFGTPPYFHSFKNAANTSIIYWNHKLLVFYEGGVPYVINPETLETVGPYQPTFFKEGFPVKSILFNQGILSCAHPKIVKDKLILFSPNYEWNSQWTTDLLFLEIDKTDMIISQKHVKLSGFIYIHDFIVTEQDYIFFESALDFNLFNYITTNNLGSSIDHASKNIVLHKINRHTNLTSHIELDITGFAFHHSSMNNTIYSTIYPKLLFPNAKQTNYGQLFATSLEDFSSKLLFPSYYTEFPVSHNNQLLVNMGHEHPLEEVINITTKKAYKNKNAINFEINQLNNYIIWLENNNQQSYLNIAPITNPNLILNKFVIPDYIPLSLHGTWVY
jgi:hypothetical protein